MTHSQEYKDLKEHPILFSEGKTKTPESITNQGFCRKFEITTNQITMTNLHNSDQELNTATRPKRWKGGRTEASKRYRQKHKEKRAADSKAWYEKNKISLKPKRTEYQRANKVKIFAQNKAWQKNRSAKLKREMIEAYGGKCLCCGESEGIFLQLDHIYNDGNIERRKHGNHLVEWQFLKNNGWPKDRHQLLCANCNYGKVRNGGICPHKTKTVINE